MAEDLDSFFKKKKSKGKKKYTTSDAIKKAVEDSQKVEEQKKSLSNDEDVRTVDPVCNILLYTTGGHINRLHVVNSRLHIRGVNHVAPRDQYADRVKVSIADCTSVVTKSLWCHMKMGQ